jgi:hypothetical protein
VSEGAYTRADAEGGIRPTKKSGRI